MSGCYVIKAELYNPSHPEYGVVTVPFPIPKEEYDHILELLEPMEIGDPIRRDCGISELDSFYTVLDRMSGLVNLDELDYLAKRLESFDDYEAAQFQTMAAKLNLTDMTDLINLTFCCQQATVITDFSNLERIGKDHYMILQGGCCSTKELEELDGVETAMLLISDNKGEITPYGVVYDNGMKLERLYDGVHFPDYLYADTALVVEVPSEPVNGQSVKSTWFFLPLPEIQIDRLITRSRLAHDCAFHLTNQQLPDKVMSIVEQSKCSIHSLNRLSEAFLALDNGERTKLNAVMDMAGPVYAEQITHLIQHLDLFEFFPDVRCAEDYGRYMIQESGRFEYDSNLEEFYDYRRYGQEKLDSEAGHFTEAGYVSYHGELSLDELMMEESSSQGFQMGGIS